MAMRGHREARATLSESLGKPPLRSSLRPVGGRRKALTMPRIARGFPPTPLSVEAMGAAGTIPLGHYHRSLVLGDERVVEGQGLLYDRLLGQVPFDQCPRGEAHAAP